eukprot:TRINITY_DN41179_c0_g1_i1.p1 TRINITY_DN41179_c0_g1~~TRINITY_DN41179_c0_g1_i1.p1  ORF type:complete len:228 (+),score=53.06 TRINITY_DN41179_c0_g1_i1:202-885(+)
MKSLKSYSSEESEEDGDETWKAAIQSAAVDSSAIFSNNTKSSPPKTAHSDDESNGERPTSNLKFYQTRAQDVLHSYLDKNLVIVSSSEETLPVSFNSSDAENDIRLFKRAPPGAILNSSVEIPHGTINRKKPRIGPRIQINEKSAEFKLKLHSVSVDGELIMLKAVEAKQKALARLQAREMAALEASRKEKQRVSLLKQKRGEKWLPAIAKEMRFNANRKNGFSKLV